MARNDTSDTSVYMPVLNGFQIEIATLYVVTCPAKEGNILLADASPKESLKFLRDSYFQN
jgi:hypothetical protein